MVTTIIFTIEAIMKIIAYGFINCGINSYMRSFANVFDFVVIICAYVSYAVAGTNSLKTLKTFRILRVLRPLRMISRSRGL